VKELLNLNRISWGPHLQHDAVSVSTAPHGSFPAIGQPQFTVSVTLVVCMTVADVDVTVTV
jgi:hypothetical protein